MKMQTPTLPAEVGRRILAELARSELVIGYIRNFGEFAAVSIELRAADSWPSSGEALGSMPTVASASFRKGAETGVPVWIDEVVIGFLVLGALARHPVLTGPRHAVAVQLLIVFAEHLSLLAATMVLRSSSGGHPAVRRARAFIDEHHAMKLPLASVAVAANLSTVHFCRVFKKTTGLCFSEYLARLRIDRAKSILHDRGMRVNEVAGAVGFSTTSHFNRVFKRIVGMSPTTFRDGKGQ